MISKWTVAALFFVLLIYRRRIAKLNRAERFVKNECLKRDAGLAAPDYGPGMNTPDLMWRSHLVPTMTAEETLKDVHMLLSLKQDGSRSLSLEEATEGVRRFLVWLDPARAATAIYWSVSDCRAIASSLLSDAGIVPHDGENRVSAWGDPPPPVKPTPLLMEGVQMVVNGTAAAAMNMFGHRSRWLHTATCRIHYYDSGLPQGGDGVPMILIHGMFTTAAASWLVLAPLLGAGRRVLCVDLLDFDYGYWCSRGTQKGQARPGGIAGHVEAVLGLLGLLLEGGAPQVDLVGHSYGGHIAKATADRVPRSVRHLHLLTPDGVGVQQAVMQFVKRPELSTLPLVMRCIVLPVLMAIFRAPNAVNNFVGTGGRAWYLSEPVPHVTQIILGDEDDLVVARAAEHIAPWWPNAEARMFVGGLHQLVVTSPVNLCQEIDAFAQRHGGQIAPMPRGLRAAMLMLAWTKIPVKVMFDNIGRTGQDYSRSVYAAL